MYSKSRAPLSSRSLNIQANSTTNDASSSSSEVTRHHPRSTKFPHRLNFYSHPPTEEITVEEFEEWAIDRLRLLADIEHAQQRNKPFEDIKTLVLERMKKYLPMNHNSAKTVDVETERKKDHYSHFVLRLAFCRSEELRQRYLRAESMLFKIKFLSDDENERRSFVDSLKFGWQVVTEEEKHSLREELISASGRRDTPANSALFAGERYFKVNWTDVTDLVSRRGVFLRGGKAYVPAREELSLVQAEFTNRLSRGLEQTAKALPRLDEDSRLLPVLEHLSMGFAAGIGTDYISTTTTDGEAITAEMIPHLAEESFPMCMRTMQETLRVSKHLKHEGRQQYSLFLKGIGLSVEEAIVFWRKSFSTITQDKFNKEYRYNVRHNYGLEGSRKNYSPKSCQQIITGPTPGANQSHGCPFRHYSEQNLSSTLQSTYSLSVHDTKEILSSVKSQHYHLACTRLFEIQHSKQGVLKGEGVGKGDAVDHPNRYFDASRRVMKEKKESEEGVKKEEGGGSQSQTQTQQTQEMEVDG